MEHININIYIYIFNIKDDETSKIEIHNIKNNTFELVMSRQHQQDLIFNMSSERLSEASESEAA